MRILVISDTHGSNLNFEKAVEKSAVDAIIFLGDGLSDIKEYMQIYKDIKFYYVKGNCDYSNEQTIGFEIIAGKKIMFTHGHLFDVKNTLTKIKNSAQTKGAEILLFGHTHNAYTDFYNGIHIFNPGSACNFGKSTYGILQIEGSKINTRIYEIE